jgi:hypothetical protein
MLLEISYKCKREGEKQVSIFGINKNYEIKLTKKYAIGIATNPTP